MSSANIFTLYLVRHGQTDWNVREVCAGQTDIPLNQQGHQEAGAIAGFFADRPLAAIYGSDLERTRVTAEKVCQQKQLSYREDPRLREINYGILEGTNSREWPQTFPELMKTWNYSSFEKGPPEGESRKALIDRCCSFLEDLVAGQPNGPVALFSHGGTIKAILTYIILREANLPINRSFGMIAVDNGSITTLRWKKNRWQIKQVNHTPPVSDKS
ncbi:MAG: histidine phosphatase family protein [Opitutales bacterium]|nr:histidine phosphatase family protein [Opitutales bacterium]MCH8541844.1 histidine phosphatase family protein [Opitutales bacterium]